MSWSLNDFDILNPRLFKAFLAASETNSFTIAADVACMTQGGISQHISKLEDQIGLPLFRRIKNRLILTDAGHHLLRYVKRYLDSMNEFRESVIGSNDKLSGLVTYAMPASCLLSPHFQMLLKKRLQYESIELSIVLEPSKNVVESVLAGKVDFGFVTKKYDSLELEFIPFCDEEYVLVGSSRFIQKNSTLEKIANSKFIRYPGFESSSELWMQSACSNKREFSYQSRNYSGSGSTIDAAILMVKGELGASIFPRHCVQSLLQKKELIEYTIDPPVLNSIFIVKLNGFNHSKRTLKLIDWFMEMKN